MSHPVLVLHLRRRLARRVCLAAVRVRVLAPRIVHLVQVTVRVRYRALLRVQVLVHHRVIVLVHCPVLVNLLVRALNLVHPAQALVHRLVRQVAQALVHHLVHQVAQALVHHLVRQVARALIHHRVLVQVRVVNLEM